ncbi:PhnA domain-containing protein [Namhaeicola litoreus]|uniref:PhnA domain-containing protein n=1 Tax=Namhaeicola litoreus TaxID=1052145 RepID=A0ABW3Y3X9_9FLAO
MNTLDALLERSHNACELCGADQGLQTFLVPPKEENNLENSVLVCTVCAEQLHDEAKIDPAHWRCLNNSMWSEHESVKVLVWRMLRKLKNEGWPQGLLEMLYLDDETLTWAKALEKVNKDQIVHLDSNKAVLENGDQVVLIKDLDVKGANFNAKRGTVVKNIRLVSDNAEQIEGKINGQQIVILNKFVKKS